MVSLFSYRRGNSIIHKAPVLLKLFCMIVICIFTFKGNFNSTVSEILSVGVILISILVFIFSKAQFKSIFQLKFVFVLGFIITVFKTISFTAINYDGLASGILYTVRFFITALFAQVVFETTSVLEIKEAFESLENLIAKVIPPFKKLNLALILSLSINFIPQIFSTWNKVKTASKARSNSTKKSLVSTFRISLQELQTLLSCLLYQAETKRQALTNRSK